MTYCRIYRREVDYLILHVLKIKCQRDHPGCVGCKWVGEAPKIPVTQPEKVKA